MVLHAPAGALEGAPDFGDVQSIGPGELLERLARIGAPCGEVIASGVQPLQCQRPADGRVVAQLTGRDAIEPTIREVPTDLVEGIADGDPDWPTWGVSWAVALRSARRRASDAERRCDRFVERDSSESRSRRTHHWGKP